MEKTDEEIIQEILDGRKQAYSDLIHRYQKQVFNLMYRFSRTDHDAADLTQEVFLKAYEKLPSYKTGYSFFSWLYTMAMNRARDWSRTRNRQNEKLRELQHRTPSSPGPGSGQERILQHGENMQLLQRAMEILSEDTREIIMLRFQHERSVREVAEIFSMSESAVKMRTSRGLKQLQDFMQNEDT